MNNFFVELKKRNSHLYYFGWLMFIAFFICFIASYFDNTIILGINAWIKPMKFYVHWYYNMDNNLAGMLSYQSKKVRAYSRVLIIMMNIEMIIITFQAARGQRSHFNESSLFNGILFTIMGISITFFVLWTACICVLFFLQKEFNISKIYLYQ